MPDSYTITETLSKNSIVTLYRGVRRKDNVPVIIKTLSTETPAPVEIERLRHEYEITQGLDSPFLLKPHELDRQKTRVRLIMEDFDGKPLSGLLGRPLETGRFLEIAPQLAAALADIHRQEIVHKDLKPDNILIQSRTGAVKLTGFGIAARLVHAPAPPPSVNLIEGSLAYMSPEQTGRVNRGVDHRSDLYSLGVIFYLMLTGELPFQAADPLEWIHCQIAHTPEPPAGIVPALPEILDAIVLKLLAKQAEERYQSARGLQLDLEHCREQWVTSGKISNFSPGKQDASDRFLISPVLYGREKEVTVLLESFEEVAATGQARFALVSGYSGIGKSSLVRELHRPVVVARGYFIAGKFNQYQRDIPYVTITRAFHDLLQQILTESDERIQSWKAVLEEALGSNGRLITDLIPHLELIIGPQPPVQELPPIEAQHHFHLVFQRFVGVFARKEHPLVLFLDDLQWLDPATLKLMAYLITNPDSGSLFLIGAYRDNEVSPSHPLMHALIEIRRSNVFLQEMVLGPLSLTHLKQLVADTLRRPMEIVTPLVRLVYEKTAGNPFFAIQFLTTLYREGLLTYDRQQQYWQWELETIRIQDITDNVVQLMLDKLKHFASSTQHVIMLTACLGNSAKINALTLLCNQPEDQLHPTLQEAIDEGLMWRMNGSYKFLHDRVQEAAYALLPEGERPAQHLNIGRLLLSNTPEDRLAENIFEIVGHLNRGSALITSLDEREHLAELNLMAGKMAKAATAYTSALTYLITGSNLMAEDIWKRRYELAFALEFHRAECEFLTGNMEAAEERLSRLSDRTDNLVDASAVACERIDVYTAQSRNDSAIETGLDYLRRVGVEWSPHPSDDEAREEYERLLEQLGDHRVEDLINLPPAGPEVCATMDVLTLLQPAALYSDQNLFALIVARAANLSLEHGNSDGSCLGYVWLNANLVSRFGYYELGYRFAKLACDLVEKRGLVRYEPRVYQAFGYAVSPWTRHLKEGLNMVWSTFATSQEIGDIAFSVYAWNIKTSLRLACGDPLPDIQSDVENGLEFTRKAGFGFVADNFIGQRGFIRTFMGLTSELGFFSNAEFNEKEFEERLGADPQLSITSLWYWLYKLQTLSYAGNYTAALTAAAKVEQLLWAQATIIEGTEYHLHCALAKAGLYETVAADEKPQYLEAIVAHQQQLAARAKHSPANYENCAVLGAAEIARLEGRDPEAMRLYEHAIQSAGENGFIQKEALANELAAGFYRSRNFDTIADAYLRKARDCYIRWGADGKVRQLDRQYPHMPDNQPLTPTTTFTGSAQQLDLLAVIKASQAISREILLPTLQETLMRLALEHAAAQRGFLLLTEGANLTINARAEITGDETQVEILPALSVSAATLPLSLLNYIRHTGEAVVLADATTEDRFVDDAYITHHKPRSVIGLPIVRQNRMTGLLYLENNLTAGAFTPDRLTALELLAAQAAVSLENARIHEALRASEQKFHAIFQQTFQFIGLLTTDGILLEVNNAALQFAGIKEDTVVGRPFWDTPWWTHSPEIQQRLREAVREASKGNLVRFETTHYDHNGNLHYIDFSLKPVTDSSGRVIRLIPEGRDITDRKQAEEEIRTLNRELEQRVRDRTAQLEAANKEMESFTYSVSHDLRAPLRAIKGFTEILTQRHSADLNDEARHYLDNIARAGDRMEQLINDLLMYSRLDQVKVRLKSIVLDNILTPLAGEFAGRIKEIGGTLEVEDNLPTVMGDRTLLTQIFTNLLDNALTYHRTDVPPQVSVTSQTDVNTATICVRDNGIGIPPEYFEKIFDIFQRLHREEEYPGTGIGLATVRKSVKMLGGELWLESETGQGSSFFIKLPRA